jgi:hypothetical protein
VADVFEIRSRREKPEGQLLTWTQKRSAPFHNQGFYKRLDQLFWWLSDSAGLMTNFTGLEQVLDEKRATDYDAARGYFPRLASQNVLLMN